jgi:hypothetical protein
MTNDLVPTALATPFECECHSGAGTGFHRLLSAPSVHSGLRWFGMVAHPLRNRPATIPISEGRNQAQPSRNQGATINRGQERNRATGCL